MRDVFSISYLEQFYTHQTQPSVNESDEHSGETHAQTVVGSIAEPDSIKDTACRPIRSGTLPARFKDFVMS